MFQPIRVSEHQEPLVPIEFIVPDEWSDDETPRPDHSSDDSDLDIEYVAPAAFMKQTKKKPLIQVMKQEYNAAEIDKIIADMEAAESETKAKTEDKEKKQDPTPSPKAKK